MRSIPLVAVVAMLACERQRADATADPVDAAPAAVPTDAARIIPKGRPAPPWPSNVPPADAPCAAHKDCAVLIDAPQSNPCCTGRVIWPVSRAYAEWTQRFRAEHCEGVICPPGALPGPEPACCSSIGRCVDHKCIGGCVDPTLRAPKVTWNDSRCQLQP